MNSKSTPRSCGCSCCASASHQHLPPYSFNRRDFLFSVGALTVGSMALPLFNSEAAEAPASSPRPVRIRRPLKVQPVLAYEIPTRKEAASWRPWCGIHTEADALKERDHIVTELAKLKSSADFPLEILPLAIARNMDEAVAIAKGDYDAVLIYAASGWFIEPLINKDRFNLMFVRHDSGPVYLHYETVHPCILRKFKDEYCLPGMGVEDVVVDDQNELLWRLRACYGLKNTLGKKIVCIGGPSGWADGERKIKAPEIARNLWKLDMVDYPYTEFGPRIKRARQDAALVRRCEEAAAKFLRQSGISLHTTRAFVNNAFLLTEVFRDIMDEAKTDAITINSCMDVIIPMAETTACLPLSLLNDEGCLAFCESDFVVIPSGILLHYISGKPVFLNDPTYPHANMVTLAHCTAPRKMDGKRAERTKILTHFESDYGAAPKVEMKLGQVCTNLVPDFACKKWVGFEGTIVGNPFLDICRSQIDVRINGDGAALLKEMKGFHWMMSYGNYLRETGYALNKLGVDLHNVSETKTA